MGGVTTADASADASGDTTGDMTGDTTAGPLMGAPGALAPLLERLGALEREGGELRGRLVTAAVVLAAKDETIAELRRRAEVAERELAQVRGMEGARAAPAPAAGFWRGLWGALAGGAGG